MNHLTASPASGSERAVILDALRGLALLGVLLDNLFAFTGWAFLTQPQREALPTWPADGVLAMLEMAFVHGKFYSIFSLLFGIGFSVILIRNEQRGVNPLKIFYRRLLVLAVFGLAHILLLWEGDILLLYALVGMLLPLFRKCSDKTILTWAFILILAPVLVDTLRVLFQFSPGTFLKEQAFRIDERNGLPQDDSIGRYLFSKDEAWSRWRKWLEPGFFYRYSDLLNDNRILKVLGMFLFGFYAGRRLMYLNLADHVPIFKKLRKWGLIIGIPTGLATAVFFIDNKSVPAPAGLLDTTMYALSVAPLALAYVSMFCLRWVKKSGETKLRWLAPLGRMALTNYLVQSLLGIFIYYGVGLNMGGYIGPVVYFAAGIVVYMVQVLYSTWWLRRYNYGPFEWLWRMLTYGKLLPLKKKPAAAGVE